MALRLGAATKRRRLGVGLDEDLRRAVYPLDGRSHEVASLGCKVERLARLGIARVRNDRAVGEELEPAVDPTPDREMPRKKIARATIANGDAEAVAEVILGVARHVDAMAAPLGRARGNDVVALGSCCFTHSPRSIDRPKRSGQLHDGR